MGYVVYATGLTDCAKGIILIPKNFFVENNLPYELLFHDSIAAPAAGDKTNYNADQRLAQYVIDHGEYDRWDDAFIMTVYDEMGRAWENLHAKKVPTGCYYRVRRETDGDAYNSWDELDIFDPQNPDGWTLVE